MHNGMQYDPIQGQGHEPLKVANSTIFKGYLLPHLQWGLANGHGVLNYLKLIRARFLILSQFLCHVNSKLAVSGSWKSLFDFNKIWYVGRGQRLMHDGMQYDPIQGQGHEPL